MGKKAGMAQVKNVKDFISLPLLYNHWYVAGTVAEFDRSPTARTLLEKSIVFFRTEAGELVALQNRCSHRAFPLSAGKLEGDNIVCAYHGARFSPDGDLVRVPSQDTVPKVKIRKYPVKEYGPFVMIWMGEGEADESLIPQLSVSHLADPNFRTVDGYFPVEGSYLLMQENLHDLTHIPYLHRETFRVDDSFYEGPPLEVSKTDHGVEARRMHEGETVETFLPPDVLQAYEGKPMWRVDYGVAPTPGVFESHVITGAGEKEGDDDAPLNQYIMHFVTPETQTTCHYWWSISFDYALDNDEFFGHIPMFFETGFKEDLVACKHMQDLLTNEPDDFRDRHYASDQHGLLFRADMLEWVEQEYGEVIASDRD